MILLSQQVRKRYLSVQQVCINTRHNIIKYSFTTDIIKLTDRYYKRLFTKPFVKKYLNIWIIFIFRSFGILLYSLMYIHKKTVVFLCQRCSHRNCSYRKHLHCYFLTILTVISTILHLAVFKMTCQFHLLRISFYFFTSN